MITNISTKIQNHQNIIQVSNPQKLSQTSPSTLNRDTVSFRGNADTEGNFIQRAAKKYLVKLQAINDAVPYNVVVFSGPSGVGKDTIIEALRKKGYELKTTVSYTTRAPRPGEIDGVHYHFITPEKFAEMDARGEFFEQNKLSNGTRYGGTLAEAESMRMGHDVIKNISADAAPKLKKQFGKDAVLIYIEAPSETEVIRRLMKRGTETIETLKSRLEYNKMQAGYMEQFDTIIMNDNLKTAVKQTLRYLESRQSAEVKALKFVKLGIKILSKIVK